MIDADEDGFKARVRGITGDRGIPESAVSCQVQSSLFLVNIDPKLAAKAGVPAVIKTDDPRKVFELLSEPPPSSG